MAFTKGSAQFTNGSTTVTNVSLTSGTLAYFASGTRVVVGANPIIAEVEAIGAPTVTSFELREPWAHTGGTYNFLANQTSEGLRDAVQAVRTNNNAVQGFIDSVDVNATANSVVQRTSNGRVKAAPATESNDAWTRGQMQSSTNDATEGRGLLVGAFGLGAPLIAPTSETDANSGIYTLSGAHFLSTSGGNNFPNAIQARFIVHATGSVGGGLVQNFTLRSATPRYFKRVFDTQSAEWTPWREIYHTGNILGTVSQSSGVPTGAIIQTITNANGTAVRFADGTQICTVSGFATSSSVSEAWTFPAAFIFPSHPNRAVISGFISQGSSGDLRLNMAQPSSGGSVHAVNAVNASNQRVAATAFLMAIGRWY